MKTRNAVKPQPTTRNGHAKRPAASTEDVLAACQDKTQEFIERCQLASHQGVDLAEMFRRKGIMEGVLPVTVRQLLARQAMEKKTVRLELDIDVGLYGILCQAAHVNGFDSWQEAAHVFLAAELSDWAEDGFWLLDNRYVNTPEVKS